MRSNKGSTDLAKSLSSNHIFGKIVWKQLFKAVVVFAVAYTVLMVAYEKTVLKRLFTDAVLETVGKVGAKWTNKSYIAFYYLNAPDEGRYDMVKLYTTPAGTTTLDLKEGNAQLKAVPFKLYSLCYYPVAFGLALASAIPLKFTKKLILLAITSIGLVLLIWAKFMIFLMNHVPRINGEVSKVRLPHQMLNAHAGMSTMLILLFVFGTAAWLGSRSVTTAKEVKRKKRGVKR